MAVDGSAFDAAGHCFFDLRQGVVPPPAAVGTSSGNSSSEVDSRSDNGNQLALSGQSPEVAPEIGLTCAAPVAMVAVRCGGGARGRTVARAMVGSGQRSSCYRGVTK